MVSQFAINDFERKDHLNCLINREVNTKAGDHDVTIHLNSIVVIH